MAAVRDKHGNKIEGQSVVTEAQAMARDHWDAVKGDSVKTERVVARQAARSSRGPQEQLKLLDQRLGAGQGAVKERARLDALIASTKK